MKIFMLLRRRRRRVRPSVKPKNMLKTLDSEKQRQEAHANLFSELNVEDPQNFGSSINLSRFLKCGNEHHINKENPAINPPVYLRG